MQNTRLACYSSLLPLMSWCLSHATWPAYWVNQYFKISYWLYGFIYLFALLFPLFSVMILLELYFRVPLNSLTWTIWTLYWFQIDNLATKTQSKNSFLDSFLRKMLLRKEISVPEEKNIFFICTSFFHSTNEVPIMCYVFW